MVADHPVSSLAGSQCELGGEVVGGTKVERDSKKAVSRNFEVGGGRMRREQSTEQTQSCRGGEADSLFLGHQSHRTPSVLINPDDK